jgi:hypothetical protein
VYFEREVIEIESQFDKLKIVWYRDLTGPTGVTGSHWLASVPSLYHILFLPVQLSLLPWRER